MRIDSGEACPSRFCNASSRIPPSHIAVACVCRSACGVLSGVRIPSRSSRRANPAPRPGNSAARTGERRCRRPGTRTGCPPRRAFMQHIAVDRVQGARLVQVHDPFETGLRPGAAGMVVAFADRDPAPAIGDVSSCRHSTSPGRSPPSSISKKHRQIPQAWSWLASSASTSSGSSAAAAGSAAGPAPCGAPAAAGAGSSVVCSFGQPGHGLGGAAWTSGSR